MQWLIWAGALRGLALEHKPACFFIQKKKVGMKASFRDFESDLSQPMTTPLPTLRHAVETVAVSIAEFERFFWNAQNCITFNNNNNNNTFNLEAPFKTPKVTLQSI